MSNPDDKVQVLRMATQMLAIASFSTVEGDLQTIFDTDLGNTCTQEEIISFLKNTQLCQTSSTHLGGHRYGHHL